MINKQDAQRLSRQVASLLDNIRGDIAFYKQQIGSAWLRADINNPNTRHAFLNLNIYRNKLRAGKVSLNKWEQTQSALKNMANQSQSTFVEDHDLINMLEMENQMLRKQNAHLASEVAKKSVKTSTALSGPGIHGLILSAALADHATPVFTRMSRELIDNPPVIVPFTFSYTEW